MGTAVDYAYYMFNQVCLLNKIILVNKFDTRKKTIFSFCEILQSTFS
jgi:hypothetical protein